MALLQLETFSPLGATETSASQETAKLIAKAYRDGHAKGFQQGADESAREHAEVQDQLRGQLIEALRDDAMEQHAAQTAAVASLLPVIDAMVNTLAPALAEAGFAEQLTTHLRTALDHRPNLRPVLHCAPEAAATLQAALTDWPVASEVVEDNRLTPLEAKLHWDDGFDHIDLDRCLAEMTESIARFRQALAPDQNEDLSHVG